MFHFLFVRLWCLSHSARSRKRSFSSEVYRTCEFLILCLLFILFCLSCSGNRPTHFKVPVTAKNLCSWFYLAFERNDLCVFFIRGLFIVIMLLWIIIVALLNYFVLFPFVVISFLCFLGTKFSILLAIGNYSIYFHLPGYTTNIVFHFLSKWVEKTCVHLENSSMVGSFFSSAV